MRYVACVVLLVWCLSGCGSNEPYPVPVQGTVTLDGQPLKEGQICFITLGQVPEPVEIKNGVFKGKAKWGQRRIEFAAYRPYQIPPSIPESMHALMKDGKENYLPDKYHTNSTLTAEVKKTGPNNDYKFDLLSK